ncbi:hypothetical protein UFOVP891_30 [uncultured Caudovirales phage]|uniref:Uncharacterized protein n=1 Tax=uncultured Caudovirales phage TaxID=2100421 RepID=A0A6J5PB36_9CAUD|nr:hypothetical protein UFOVP472_38 [uncultured Caudovirales phage]CAB4169080.1 hypothetical protein UFOVP891_30 [uncultured Caudovirales phage]CAB4180778.1 hypothetical protein UFOVP1053_38 [uncultured Caudovirales phage]CAB4195791.1 hypothetical protein UFOVP1297_36 [uncultured Caudovirales phage]CAB4221878.1 hypothetical protein UFOVP1647_14 [uncultured Caudovirales phage]
MHPSMSHRAAEQMQRDMQSLSPAELEAFEERAAIMEFTGGATREFAESKAMLLTLAQRTK